MKYAGLARLSLPKVVVLIHSRTSCWCIIFCGTQPIHQNCLKVYFPDRREVFFVQMGENFNFIIRGRKARKLLLDCGTNKNKDFCATNLTVIIPMMPQNTDRW